MAGFFRRNKTKFKVTALATIVGSSVWMVRKLLKTFEILNSAFDPSIIEVFEPQASDASKPIKHSSYVVPAHKEHKGIKSGHNFIKFMYARRLMAVAQCDNPSLRLRAVEHLSKLHLDDWHYSLVGHMCDARTAIGIARTMGSELQIFLPPIRKYGTYNDNVFMHLLKDYLTMLDNANSTHPCLRKTISKVFIEPKDIGRLIDQDHNAGEVTTITQNKEEQIPLCLNTIRHHCSYEKYIPDILCQNGLYLLMEIYKRFENDLNINITLCNIMSYLCINQNSLEQIYRAGWIPVLATWLRSPDIRLSGPAAQALANLDQDDIKDSFSSNVYLLHPAFRTTEQLSVDVVFVHGLLGNVFYTWRNNASLEKTLDLIGKQQQKQKESMGLDTTVETNEVWRSDCTVQTSDPVMREFLDQIEEQRRSDWDDIGTGFEFVFPDIPEKSNDEAIGPYSTMRKPITSKATQCWPRDWLPKDCPNIRVLGVNYNTLLSNWAAACPEMNLNTTLDQRSEQLIKDLMAAGVGDRPIVWVTHSMGGLVVKNLLSMVSNSADPVEKNIFTKTKAIIFYSTPHFGSKTATLNFASSYLIMPSMDVQELREGSPNLLRIHQDFLKILEKNPMKICSIIENKPTQVSSLKVEVHLVEPTSGNPGVGEYFEIPQNHLSICKPVNKESFLYRKVLLVIQEVVDIVNREESDKRKSWPWS